MNRRDFLRMLGLGAAAVAAPAIVVPERRIWQVAANAPVGRRVASVRGLEQHAGYLVTYADQAQEVVPYDRASTMPRVRELGMRAPSVRYEDYEHLLPPRDHVSARRMAALRTQPWRALAQHDPAHQPTMDGARVKALRNDGTVVLADGQRIDPATRAVWERSAWPPLAKPQPLSRARILEMASRLYPNNVRQREPVEAVHHEDGIVQIGNLFIGEQAYADLRKELDG